METPPIIDRWRDTLGGTMGSDPRIGKQHASRFRSYRLGFAVGAAALAGTVAGVGFVPMAPAGATTCAVGSSCTFTGTLTLAPGTITLTAPDALTWAAPLTGLDQHVVDVNTADQSLSVNNALGAPATWAITASATTFTSGTNVLPNAGTLSLNGSIADSTSSNKPSAACATGSTCSLPVNGTSYPVAMTTAAASPPVATVYSNTDNTVGRGHINIGALTGGFPVGWWLNIPGNAVAGVYTSTFTMAVTTGP